MKQNNLEDSQNFNIFHNDENSDDIGADLGMGGENLMANDHNLDLDDDDNDDRYDDDDDFENVDDQIDDYGNPIINKRNPYKANLGVG